MIIFQVIGMIAVGSFSALVIYTILSTFIRHCASSYYIEIELAHLRNMYNTLKKQIEESQKLSASPKEETK